MSGVVAGIAIGPFAPRNAFGPEGGTLTGVEDDDDP